MKRILLLIKNEGLKKFLLYNIYSIDEEILYNKN